MYKRVFVFVGLIWCCFAFFSWRNDDKAMIKNEISFFLGKEIIIPNSLIAFNTSKSNKDEIFNKEFIIYSYVDSIDCSECKIKQVLPWMDYLQKYTDNMLSFVLIFNTNDIEELQYNIKLNGFNLPYFVDIDNKFKEKNPSMPTISVLKTFLTHNNKVVLIGNPNISKRLDGIYQETIHSKIIR